MSIQYAFVVYMVGLPTHINLTSLSRANHFYRPKGVFVKRTMHFRVRPLLLSPSRRLHLCALLVGYANLANCFTPC